jgi:hypothetical protein
VEDPTERFDTRKQFHPVDATFIASEINDLFVRLVQMFGEMHNGRTARVATRIVVA